MMHGAVIRSMKYSGKVPRGSVVVFSDEDTVKLPATVGTDKLCGVYCQYKAEDADDAGTGEAIPITVLGPARVCVSTAVTAGSSAYIIDTSGEVVGAKPATGDSRLIGRFLQDGAKDEYVLVLVQMGE